MPNCRSTSNQNTRVFAPHVILKQDTNRLVLTLRSDEGYSLPPFTAGDVIRYDPDAIGYVKAQANNDVNSEVVGIVETVGNTTTTVVVSGSIQYPTARLDSILDGGDGGKDILFLDPNVAGGLTGTIDLDQGVQIVKPVLQVAPHGAYNGIVVNYIGYKSGSAVVGTEESLVPVVFGRPGLEGEREGFLDVSENRLVSSSEYPSLYSYYGTDGGNYQEEATVTSGVLLSSYVGSQIYQLTSGGARINAGTVTGVNIINNTVTIEKTSSTELMNSSAPIYVNGTPLVISDSTISHFTIPKAVGAEIVQNGETLVPYIQLKNATAITIPSETTMTNLNVTGVINLGSISDLEAKINDLEYKINLLNSRIAAF
jgi:hypothetical protein